MEQSNVVLRYRDGRTERVSLVDIDTEREFAVVKRDDDAQGEVPFSLLKGAYFKPIRGIHRDAHSAFLASSRSQSLSPLRTSIVFVGTNVCFRNRRITE